MRDIVDGIERINNALRKGGFVPSSYDANLDVTVAGTPVSMSLPTGVSRGAGRIHVTNLGATSENMRLAFGTSIANAENNLTVSGGIGTTGMTIVPVVDGGQPQEIGVPVNAVAVAVVNAVASDTPEMAVVSGV